MKYLKKYEQYIPKLQKYVIWNSSDYLYIFEIISEVEQSDFTRIHYKPIYFKKKDSLKIEEYPTQDISRYSSKNIEENIIYQSDNIDDCLEMLPIILKTKKYNI